MSLIKIKFIEEEESFNYEKIPLFDFIEKSESINNYIQGVKNIFPTFKLFQNLSNIGYDVRSPFVLRHNYDSQFRSCFNVRNLIDDENFKKNNLFQTETNCDFTPDLIPLVNNKEAIYLEPTFITDKNFSKLRIPFGFDKKSSDKNILFLSDNIDRRISISNRIFNLSQTEGIQEIHKVQETLYEPEMLLEDYDKELIDELNLKYDLIKNDIYYNNKTKKFEMDCFNSLEKINNFNYLLKYEKEFLMIKELEKFTFEINLGLISNKSLEEQNTKISLYNSFTYLGGPTNAIIIVIKLESEISHLLEICDLILKFIELKINIILIIDVIKSQEFFLTRTLFDWRVCNYMQKIKKINTRANFNYPSTNIKKLFDKIAVIYYGFQRFSHEIKKIVLLETYFYPSKTYFLHD